MTQPSQRRAAAGGDGDTEQRLLDATIDIIQTEGPIAATSRAITVAADANLAAITYYFGSKDALVASALAEIGRRLLTPVIASLRETGSPIEQMMAATRLLPDILNAHPAALTGYVHALAAALTDPSVRDAISELHAEMANALAAQIDVHQQSEIVPEWIDPHVMAAVIISLVDGVAVNSAAALIPVDTEEIANQFGALLFHAALPAAKAKRSDSSSD